LVISYIFCTYVISKDRGHGKAQMQIQRSLSKLQTMECADTPSLFELEYENYNPTAFVCSNNFIHNSALLLE
jgi:hypothetical protein